VPTLIYREAARRDIAEIAAFIEQESQDRAVAEAS
jgi:plasmid stabilization system protein ParE